MAPTRTATARATSGHFLGRAAFAKEQLGAGVLGLLVAQYSIQLAHAFARGRSARAELLRDSEQPTPSKLHKVTDQSAQEPVWKKRPNASRASYRLLETDD